LACTTILALVTAGCAPVRTRPITIVVIQPNAEQISASPDFNRATVAVTFQNDLQREDYVMFRGNGRRMELVYSHSTAPLTALRYTRFQLQERAESWNFNQGKTTGWGPDRFTTTPLAEFIYRRYWIRDHGKRACAAFESAWDIAKDDARLQPRRVLFGYYCNPDGQPLPAARLAKILGAIKVRDVEKAISVPHALRRRTSTGSVVQKGAMDTARGVGVRPAAGNRDFPYLFARRYIPGNAPGGGGVIRSGTHGGH